MQCGIKTCILVTAAVMIAAFPISASQKTGEVLFRGHCSMCHPDGGNIMNPKKTLRKQDREKNNIKTAGDIVKFMRNPGPGMPKFDSTILPDKDAMSIAEYILKTFKN